jgi:vacuolar-type H+-ATPase subunit I/STV1
LDGNAALLTNEAGSLMLALGLVLLIIGVVLVVIAAVRQPPSAAPLGPLGWLLVIIGLILALVAVLVNDGDLNAGIVGGLGMVAIPPPHHHAVPLHEDPPEPVAGGLTDRQPVVVAFIVGAVPLLIAAISAVADLFASVPDWIVPLATIIGTLTTGLAALWARGRVTPTALPKLDEGTMLVPMVEREEP